MEYKKITALLAVVTVVVLCLFAVGGYFVVRAFSGTSIDENKSYTVNTVKDGDTFTVVIGRHIETVRMLGIDTPETVDPRKPVQCHGKESSDKAKQLLLGKFVKLKLNPNREEKDKYGRYLAYVYIATSTDSTGDSVGVFVNEFLLANGYAREYTYGKPYSLQREFREIEQQAKKSKKGLWGKCDLEMSQ